MSKRIPMPRIFMIFFLTTLLIPLLAACVALAEPEIAELTELWRAGGEDDEIFFGSVASIRSDPNGNILILDGQLSEVHVYTPDGEYLRAVYHEGDGPGEIRRPNDMFVTADGTICALSGSFSARQDALYVQPDDLILVVVGALDAFLNQQAVASDEDGGESTAQPLEVICYRMGR